MSFDELEEGLLLLEILNQLHTSKLYKTLLFEVAKCGFKINIKLYQAVNAPDIVGCLAAPVMK
jgi:hypothetical protein